MTMICNLVRYGRRQLHTIVSREIIKPSSPTPSHLKTHNLSIMDQITPNTFMPIVAFYPNTRGIYRGFHDKTLNLKNSLSQTLTKYYPFAGRFAKVKPSYVDCNDNGAEFLEASIDTTLSDFLQNSSHEDLDQFFPHGLVHFNSNYGDDDLQSDQVTPLEVQINHFECGGVAVAVSLSHKIADGSSLVHFINDWAKMTRRKDHEFSINDDPFFFPFQYMNLNPSRYIISRPDDCLITTRFMFPGSKINELKLKVKAMTAESGQPITNPTRVEVLTWLLYKCAMAAATKNNSGSFKPTGAVQIANLRGLMMEQLPEKSIGNLIMPMEILINKESEMNPESFISGFKKQKMQFKSLRNIETVFGALLDSDLEEQIRKVDDVYIFTSLCGYHAYEIDFGWGEPVKVALAGVARKNTFILTDAPNKDGIEVLMCLGEHDLAIVQSDPELLAFGYF